MTHAMKWWGCADCGRNAYFPYDSIFPTPTREVIDLINYSERFEVAMQTPRIQSGEVANATTL